MVGLGTSGAYIRILGLLGIVEYINRLVMDRIGLTLIEINLGTGSILLCVLFVRYSDESLKFSSNMGLVH